MRKNSIKDEQIEIVDLMTRKPSAAVDTPSEQSSNLSNVHKSSNKKQIFNTIRPLSGLIKRSKKHTAAGKNPSNQKKAVTLR